MSDKISLLLPTFLVMFAAAANLARVLWNIPVIVGTWVLPGWTGIFFFVGFGLVAAWSLRALCRFCRKREDVSNP